ncbi:MAG: hypothetical protein IJ207_04630 [Treponema sp.]|uniref:hypothetical protein n=1 Tax=Treponema sp. TaxID=166 RepID=UPI0025F784C4|nr:hypothetical protein [Treponema sp.]MBQ9281467.1 hypothetical protein [Treponema sp.]
MNDENLISAQEMIMTAFTNIERTQIEQSNALLKAWKFTVQSIKSNGKNGENLGMNLYSHSRIIDLKNEILLIECDHPGWIQTFRLYQKYILTGLKRGSEMKISSLAFRLRGTNMELHSEISEERERRNLEKRIEKEEEMIRKFDEGRKNSDGLSHQEESNSHEKKEIPENLQRILDRLKNDILTDNK